MLKRFELNRLIAMLLSLCMLLSGMSMSVNALTDTSTIATLGTEVNADEVATIMPSGYSLYGIENRLQKLQLTWGSNNITINNSNIGIIDEFTVETGMVSSLIYLEITSLDAYTVNNPFSILFEDCTTINGRSVNVTLDVNSITLNEVCDSGYKASDATIGDRAILMLSNSGVTDDFTFGNGGHITYEGIHYYQAREIIIDYTLTATYADDNSNFDYGFYQMSYDIDIGNSASNNTYFREAWEVYDDYTSAVYVSDQFDRLIKKTSYSSIYAANGTGNITETTEDERKSDMDKSGILISSSENVMRARNYGCPGSCGCVLMLYIDNFNSVLEKTVDTSTYDTSTANTRIFSITYSMPEFYSDTYKKYTSLVLYDELPEGVTYKSAKVIDESTNTDITSKGTLKYDSSANKISFTFSDSYISDESNYNGQDITLEIVTSITGNDVITNPGYAEVSGVTLTDTADVNPLYKITTEVINGTIDADITNIAKGSDETISYTPNSGYTIKSVTVDGTSVRTDTYEASYDFTNITGNHTIKVVYAPAARTITVTKKIKKSDINYSNGTPTFVFHLEGTDVNGDTYSYNQIASMDESLAADSDGYISVSCTFNVNAGTYKSTEDVCSRYEFDSTESLANATAGGSTVTYDVKTNTSASATYINKITNFGGFSDATSIINNCGSTN
ncbi:MAG: hypothetical protein LUG21_02430 [Clostridiales bacterium]|nr:hypothetical protein [Clostridiales bacterium]